MEWQTIDTAPKDGEKILLWNPNWDCPIIAYWNDFWDEPFWNYAEELLSDACGAVEDATHWCRYPTPPRAW